MKSWIKILIIVMCIAVLGILFYLIHDMQNKIELRKENNISFANEIKNITNTVNQNVVNNTTTKKDENTIKNETIQNTIIEPSPQETPSQSTKEEGDINDELNEEENRKEAIELVKKKWGENDDSVYFTNEGKNDNGEYLVAVRSKSSTYIEDTFKVNVENKTVKIIL